MKNYQTLTRRLFDMDPQNPDWIMELSYAHNNMAALHINSGLGIDAGTIQHMDEAVRLMEEVVRLKPDDNLVVGNYATTLAWAADIQIQACNLEEAILLRERVRVLAEGASRFEPGNNDLLLSYAFSLNGVARVQTYLGRMDLAEQNIGASLSILEQLLAVDSGNEQIRKWLAYRKVMWAGILFKNGQFEAAQITIQALMPESQPDEIFSNQAGPELTEYMDLLVLFAEIESRFGNTVVANSYLQEALQLQYQKAPPEQWDRFDMLRLQKMRYQWWVENDQAGLAAFANPAEPGQGSDGNFQSCIESDYEARMSLLDGDRGKAAALVTRLLGQGYADPGFKRFCVEYELCSGDA
jgi:tetratricopeptide (TPR) repeat protein